MKKAFYADLDTWKRILKDLQYPRNMDQIIDVVNSYQMPLDEFKKECEVFYATYLNLLGYQPTQGLSSKLTKQFNSVAQILQLIGNSRPEDVTPNEQSVFLDLLMQENDSVPIAEEPPKTSLPLTDDQTRQLAAYVKQLDIRQGSDVSILLNKDFCIIRSTNNKV